jgi:hypothetical protein
MLRTSEPPHRCARRWRVVARLGPVHETQGHQERGRVPALEPDLELRVARSNCVRRSGILSWEHPINNSGPAAPIRFTILPADGVPCFAKSAHRRDTHSEAGTGAVLGKGAE